MMRGSMIFFIKGRVGEFMFFYILKPKRRPKTSNDTNMIFFSYLLRSEILTSLKEKLFGLGREKLCGHWLGQY